ncbi:MAG TPA: MBL fold metallo-hydrolase [Anaerolineales bacterium]
MDIQYVTEPTTRLVDAPAGKLLMVLIYGDEVTPTGPAQNGFVPVDFRGHPGFLKETCLGPQPTLEMYFIDVGTGDSIFIVTPARKKIMIDGGLNNRALGFLAWKYHLDQAQEPVEIDLLVLSHGDDDHISGLIPVLNHPKLRIKQVVQSGIAVFKDGVYNTPLGDLDPTNTYLTTRLTDLAELAGLKLSSAFRAWVKAIQAQGAVYTTLDASSGPFDVGDPSISLEALSPRLEQCNGQPSYRWFGEKARTINGHSLVLRLTCGKVSALFPGDLNLQGAQYLMADPALLARLDAHIFKAPHHGSKEFYPPFLQAVRPQVSVISSGDDRDYGHPNAIFLGSIGMCSRSSGPLVFSTEIAANFVALEQKNQPAGSPPEKDKPLNTLKGDERQRFLFKRRLHGMINVRTDGQSIFAARRVASPIAWEHYGPLKPAAR